MSDTCSPEISERDLIAAAQHDPQAFERLYQLFLPRVYSYVSYRVGQAESTEELVSDVFLKGAQALPTFEWRHPGSFGAWLFRIAHNVVLNHLRSADRHTKWQAPVSLDDLAELHSTAPSPEEVALRQEQNDTLRRLLLSLPQRRQEIITLRFFGELHNHEIASVLDLDERTVASHLCRGLRDLHALWLAELARLNSLEQVEHKDG
ncbi:MAG: sigma-70 family RNA polymerase sigma factor [Chloroflexota bacterium]|nr:sigma-70 family RNA polymerase sigma factor [Chloroflexota bacterium]MDQ5865785.1 sigma-70 family RNA polymerase sigma factor [Chloroflexota bacterium]